MTGPDAGMHEDLVELALGLLTGPERDRLLAHLSRCPSCRDELSGLVGTATSMWEATRPVEPRPGFEQRVLAAMDPSVGGGGPRRPRRPRRPRWWALVAAAAAAVLVVVAGVAAGWRLGAERDGRFVSEYEETLRQLGGRALAGAGLVDAEGRTMGRIFVYEGESSWLFVELEEGPAGMLSVFVA